jgi:Ca2+/H+ antiporter
VIAFKIDVGLGLVTIFFVLPVLYIPYRHPRKALRPFLLTMAGILVLVYLRFLA